VSEANPYSGPRWLPFVLAAMAAVTLIIAVATTSLDDWSVTNYFFGAVILVFVIGMLIAGIRGSFNLLGRWKGKTSMILAIVAVIAAVVVLAGSLVADEWDQGTILTTGLWATLLVLFAAAAVEANKKRKAGQ